MTLFPLRRTPASLAVGGAIVTIAAASAVAVGTLDGHSAIRRAVIASLKTPASERTGNAAPAALPAQAGELTPAPAVAADVLTHLAILRRPPGPNDRLPSDAQRDVADAIVSLYGVNVALARQAFEQDGKAIYLVPGGENVCVMDQSGGGSCEDLTNVMLGRLFVEEIGPPDTAPGHFLLLGVAPNSVTSVEVTDATGTPHAAPVHSNAWLMDIASPPSSLVFRSDAHAASVHLGS